VGKRYLRGKQIEPVNQADFDRDAGLVNEKPQLKFIHRL